MKPYKDSSNINPPLQEEIKPFNKMKHFILPSIFAIALCSCQSDSTAPVTERGNYDSSYQPATFADPDRQARIAEAFPVIEKMYSDYAALHHLPAISFGLVTDDGLLLKGNYGHTDVSNNTPATSASLFRIASMTKSFTAMAILKLRDEGKLDLEDPVEKYVSEMKGSRYPTADAPRITIRHLLTHGGGFPEDNPWGDRQLADTDKDLVDFLNKQITFSNPPGVAYEYSNLGFALLGKIITTVSGRRYQDYIRENIWIPLGMKTSEWEYTKIDPKLLAHGYRWLNEKWNDEALLPDTPDGSWGAMGSMITSIDEFSRYMQLHLAAWPPSNVKDDGVLKRSSLREMHHPWRVNGLDTAFRYSDGRACAMVSSYCYGLNWLRDCDGRIYVGHSGGLPGFGSQWRMLPDYGIAIASFSNRTYAPMTAINLRVLDTLVKLAGLQKRVIPASPILNKRKQQLVALLPNWQDAETSGIFAENFFADYVIDSLRKKATELYNKAGRIISIREMVAQNQLRGKFILDGENADIEIYFTLSPENPPLIQEYRIKEVTP